MGKVLDITLIDYQRAWFIKTGIRKGRAVYKVTACQNWYTVTKNKSTFSNNTIDKETTIGVYDSLDEAQKAFDRAADYYTQRIEDGTV